MRRLKLAIILLLSSSALFALSEADLVSMMEMNNPDVLKAQSDYRSSQLDVKDAKAGRGPTIDLTMSGTYMYKPPIGPISVSTENLLQQLSNQGVDVSAFSSYPNAYLSLYDGMDHMLYSFSLSIAQPIFTWGKITNAIKLYEKVSNVRSLQIATTVRKNKSQIKGHLQAISYLRAMNTLLDEEQKTADRLVEIMTSMRDNGMVLDQDLLKVQIQMQQIEVAKSEIAMQLASQEVALQVLTSKDDLSVDTIEFTPDTDAMMALFEQGQQVLVAKASNPIIDNLQMLTNLQEVADLSKNISSASVNWKPDLALKATLGYGGSRFPLVETDWYRQDYSVMNFTVAIQSTIYDGGKKIRDVKRSEEKIESARIDYDNAVLQIKNQVVSSYLTMALDKSKLDYQDLKIESDVKDSKQKQELFQSGYGNESDYLQAELTRQGDELEKLKLQLDYATNAVTISYLIGE